MKHNSTIFILLVVAFALSSCVATKRTAYHQNVSNTAIIQAPLISDMEVDVNRKVSATYRAYKSNEADAKQGALYDAMKQNNCDVILHPYYETKFYPKVIEVTVSGICARYKTVRKPNLEDISTMQELTETMPLYDPAAFAAKYAPSAPSLQGGPMAQVVAQPNLRLGEDWNAYRRVRRSGLGLLITGAICLPVGVTNMGMGFPAFAQYEDGDLLAQGIIGTFLTLYGVIGITVGSKKLKSARSMKPVLPGSSLSLITKPVNGSQTVGLAFKF
jgi:hypothetical protein